MPPNPYQPPGTEEGDEAAPSRPFPDWSKNLRLAEKVANLLADGQPRTVKEITHALTKQQNYPIQGSGVNTALVKGATYFGFLKVEVNRWTLKPRSVADE